MCGNARREVVCDAPLGTVLALDGDAATKGRGVRAFSKVLSLQNDLSGRRSPGHFRK
jgi:hypothetical protein